MTCREIEDRVALYAGGDLDAKSARDVERHVGICPACRGLLADVREQRETMAEWGDAEPSEDALCDMRAGVLAGISRGDARPGILARLGFGLGLGPARPVAWGLAGLAAAALVFFAVWATVSQTQDGQPAQRAAAQPGQAEPQAAVVPATRSAETAPAPRGSRADVRGAIPAPPPRAFAAAEIPTVMPARPKVVGTREAGASQAIGSRAAVADARAAADLSNAPAGSVRRIEIQTADPDIRIIWLMPQQGAEPGRAGLPSR